MRVLILVAGALALAACSNNDGHDNTTNVDENLTAENIVSNDVTAIDAVTGDDANMAASAEVGELPSLNADANDSAPAKGAAKPADTKTEAKSAPKPAAKPAPSTAATSNSGD